MTVRLRVVVVPMVLLAVACGQGSGAPRSSSAVTQRPAPTSVVVSLPVPTTATLPRTDPPAVPSSAAPTVGGTSLAGSTKPSVVPPAVVSTSPQTADVGTPTLAPPRGPTEPWLVAVRADGDVELWAAAGKVQSFRACAPSVLWGCLVEVAVSNSAVWLVRYDDGDGHPDLLRASRLDGHVQPLSFEDLVPGGTDVRSIAVSADDGTLWFVAADRDPLGRAKLYVRDHAGTRPVRPDLVAIDVALSRDGRRLAYSGYRDPGDGSYPSHAVLVVREVATGAERTLALEAQAGTPVAPYSLAWSRDGRHLAFDLGWEGGVPEVLDVDAAATLDDARPPPGIEPEAWQAVPTCWTGPGNLAIGRWRSGIDGPNLPGDLDDLDLATGRYRPRGVNLFGLGMACRDDGAVAVRPEAGFNDAGPLPTELVVIRPDGSTTVLGRGYTQIVAP